MPLRLIALAVLVLGLARTAAGADDEPKAEPPPEPQAPVPPEDPLHVYVMTMGPGDEVLDDANDAESTQQPDAGSDRAAPTQGGDDAPPEPKRPPLTIKEIEELEDDAPGG